MAVELVRTEISPDFLDTIGKSFRFRHGIGVAEWLKNALDQYLRLRQLGREPRPGNWPVIISLIDGSSPNYGPNLAVIDFGGTSIGDIEDFFLLWGSRTAASLGHRIDPTSVTGGHGNGGKFYMREMWRGGARFLTYQRGKSTSLVIEKRDDGNTGYWEFKEVEMGWRDALERALPEAEKLSGARKLIAQLESTDPSLIAELDAGHRGLTAVVGRRAVQVLSSNDLVHGGKWDHQRLVDAIRDAPQARRPIRELAISVFINSTPVLERLVPDVIDDDPDWPSQKVDLPTSVILDADLKTDSPVVGQIRIRKAAVPLTGRLRDRNTLWVLDQHGNPIASYPIRDLPLSGASPVLQFMHAELDLNFPGTDSLVQNDRERLASSQTTSSIIQWVADRIWEQVQAIDKAERDSSRRNDLEIASILNDQLNQHAHRFLEELQTQVFVDVIQDPTGGGAGPRGGGGTGDGGQGTGGEGSGGQKEVPGTEERVRRPKFPQVLLSDFDPDPATGGTQTKHLTDRHPPLDQDDTDRLHNVWWINTQHVFAKEAMQRGGPKGLAFKNLQLHMFRDVVQREALRYRQRREAELSLDRVENELAEIANRFLSELPVDLVAELLS